ncbi:MAG: radical SAM protein [Vicinamibacteraceae bacterium]|nr:radical SAM protein [Vicinamibacteraceae bacterium]
MSHPSFVPLSSLRPGPAPDELVPAAPPLRLMFWELTKACNLKCQHCRAVPESELAAGELNTRESFGLIDQIADIARPVLILSGGEPLYRKDVFDIGRYGVSKGFRMALATNGTLVDDDVAGRIRDAGFSRVSISLDGARPETHDGFRGIPGSHAAAIAGLQRLRARGVSMQINSTIARHNVHELPDMLDLALSLGADALHLFMLVPVGCGVELAEREMLPTDEYERVLHWFYDQSKQVEIDLKATCAPHYFRIRAQRIVEERKQGDRSTPFIAHGTRLKAAPDPAGGRPLSTMTRGCLAGTAVCFVSNMGEIYPCGYLPVSAGNVRQQTFGEIWRGARVFRNLRDYDTLTGKCGECRYTGICGGCRARAFAETGDYLGEEPFCSYEPAADTAPVTAMAASGGHPHH